MHTFSLCQYTSTHTANIWFLTVHIYAHAYIWSLFPVQGSKILMPVGLPEW